MGGAKEWLALPPITNKTDIWCRFTYRLQFWIMTGIFYSWDRSIFQYQTMCKSSIELGLVYKTFIIKHAWETPLLPRKKQNASTVYVTLGSSGSWTRLCFPYNQKHTSLETFFLSKSCPVLPNEAHWWARSSSRSGRCVHGCVLPGEMPI